jgi:hypothetical protein
MLESEYQDSINGLNNLFDIPEALRQHFVQAFDSAISTENLPNSVRQRLMNQKRALLKIQHDTLQVGREKYLGQLYEYGLIFIVSVSEQILKSAFNNLVVNNLEKIQIEKTFKIQYTDLKTKDFLLNRDFWASQVVNELFDTRNPQEKANFQNIKAIESLFQTYFDLSLEKVEGYSEAAANAHQFFQIRHILVHNQGIVDGRFIRNLEIAGIATAAKYPVGKKIIISHDRFERCRYIFGGLFRCLDVAIGNSSLALPASVVTDE